MELPAQQYQIVFPQREALPGGRECALEDILVVRECAFTSSSSAMLPCEPDVDCVLSSTPAYTGPCTNACGGTSLRVYSVVTPQSGHGAPCDWNAVFERMPCGSSASPECEALTRCDHIDWSQAAWERCDVPCGRGTQKRYREPTGPEDTCPLAQERECTGLFQECPGATEGCTPPTWDDVETMCYMRCLGVSEAEQLKILSSNPSRCEITEELLEAACPGFSSQHCPAPRDCIVSAWSSWGECTRDCSATAPEGGTQTRTRRILEKALSGGVRCDELPMAESRPCNNAESVTYAGVTYPPVCSPVDCELGPWSDATDCSVPCGGGLKVQTRTVTTAPSAGGRPCPAETAAYVRNVPCNTQACEDCTLSSWESYAAANPGRDAEGYGPCVNGVQSRGPRPLVNGEPAAGCNIPENQIIQFRACNSSTECPLGPGESQGGHPSELHVCSGHGTCAGGRCVCEEGYAGPSCAQRCPTDEAGRVCSGHGMCLPGATACTCDLGYAGADCSIDAAALNLWPVPAADGQPACDMRLPSLCPLLQPLVAANPEYMGLPAAAFMYRETADSYVLAPPYGAGLMPLPRQCLNFADDAGRHFDASFTGLAVTFSSDLEPQESQVFWRIPTSSSTEAPVAATASALQAEPAGINPENPYSGSLAAWTAPASQALPPSFLRVNVAATAAAACNRSGLDASLSDKTLSAVLPQDALQAAIVEAGSAWPWGLWAAEAETLPSSSSEPASWPVVTSASAWSGVTQRDLHDPAGPPVFPQLDGLQAPTNAAVPATSQDVRVLPAVLL
jgi:hypothetical protein